MLEERSTLLNVEKVERIQLVFGTEASIGLSHTLCSSGFGNICKSLPTFFLSFSIISSPHDTTST